MRSWGEVNEEPVPPLDHALGYGVAGFEKFNLSAQGAG